MVRFHADRLYQRGKAREAYEWLARTRSRNDPSPLPITAAPRIERKRRRG
jgi:hypothetical protein